MRTPSSHRQDFWTAAMALASVMFLCTSTNARAQAFANVKQAAVDYSKADIEPREACENLAKFKADELVQLTTREVAGADGAPAHCRVSGVLSPEIAFEVNLPARWNGRFYMIGNGGHAGEGPDDPGRALQRTAALQHGFAMASTNTGHDARKEPQATFVLSNPQKAIDYAYRAVHLTAVTAKRITNEYYGRPVTFSYWNSCSNGGRQGLIEAQRYPEDFNGIVANAPWVDQTGFTIGALWTQRALTDAPIPPQKLSLIADRVMARCDRTDGLADGLIDDPRRCDFEPSRDVPGCPAGTDSAECLTPAQAGTLKKIYEGVISRGRPYFAGFMHGSEAVITGPGGTASAWSAMLVPTTADAKPAVFSLAESTMKYLVFDPPKPDYDFRTFDFDRDIALLERWGKLANADNPDLSAFRKRGGKLLMTYGWADQILQPMMGVNYYERAVATNGPQTTDFFRLFMLPGMAHCGGGAGPDRHDPVTAVIDWVENGKAPESLIASKAVNGQVVRTRPVCPYPQVARYKGEGSIDEAANFRCIAP
ncbi:MAG TPA: tannase/feruloyl esterase family alpha/beta hydrolase [Vicinamibacterales bacterium]